MEVWCWIIHSPQRVALAEGCVCTLEVLHTHTSFIEKTQQRQAICFAEMKRCCMTLPLDAGNRGSSAGPGQRQWLQGCPLQQVDHRVL
jgi:hypothetical protein